MTLLRLLWQVPLSLIFIIPLILLISEYATARASRRTKDIPYVAAAESDFSPERHTLDVYSPRDGKGHPVVVFIHGGSWNSGSKNTYTFIGRRLAKLGVVGVIINYRLAPAVEVPAMADDCARAVAWTQQHIADYGGDPNRIYVLGHSAGGGLAALLATKDDLFTSKGIAQNPVKGAILDDPAGLDMFDYLQKMEYPNDEQYLVPFGKDSTVWRTVSALYHLQPDTPPMLVYVGERTYPSILNSTAKFRRRLQQLGIRHQFTMLPGKSHIGMVLQLFWKDNVIYRDLLRFVVFSS
ncbi:alpha/beta hydrolase [Nibrella viscosa]|uniref:Alpha/beta hydrolase n=1 Tax=Nibrella viscosa TaxID=1084524 RepID=A0ABP8JY94_9BACT